MSEASRTARVVGVALIAVAGALGGAMTVLTLQDRAGGDPPPSTPSVASSTTTTSPAPPPPTQHSVLLAWTSGGLPDGFAARAASLPRVDAVTEVAGDLLELAVSRDADGTVVDRPPEGMVVPLDALAVDPDTYAPFATKGYAESLRDLGPGDALLGSTSAALRRIGSGGTLELADGRVLNVEGVVPDEIVGAAEVVVATRPDGPVTTPRYTLVLYSGPRAEMEAALRGTLADPASIRFRSPAETPYLRHGDAVLPQSHVKAQFGEFAYRRLDDSGTLELDPKWADANLVTQSVPILGRVTCHRTVIDQLAAALAELEADGLAWVVDPNDYGGCFAPRIATNGHSVSRHSWGIAIDLNSAKFPLGFSVDQDSRLVDAMLDHGFTSGSEWLVPDAAHFEWVGGQPGD